MVQMNIPPESVVSAAVFKGINQTDGCSTAAQSSSKYWEFKDAENASSDCFPALCGRKELAKESTETSFSILEDFTILAHARADASEKRAEVDFYFTQLSISATDNTVTIYRILFQVYQGSALQLIALVPRVGASAEDPLQLNPPCDMFIFGNKLILNDNGSFYQGDISENGEYTNVYRVDEKVSLNRVIVRLCQKNGDQGYSYIPLSDIDFKSAAPSSDSSWTKDGRFWINVTDPSFPIYRASVKEENGQKTVTWYPFDAYLGLYYVNVTGSGESFLENLQVGDRVRVEGLGINGISDNLGYVDELPLLEVVENDAFGNTMFLGVVNGINPLLLDTELENVSAITPFPKINHITLCNNRIWGVSDRDATTVYASEMGHYRNWYYYNKGSDASWSQGVASHGQWTGICTYNATPYLFKENEMVKIAGNKPSNYYPIHLQTDGLERGSQRSLCVVEGFLLWQGKNGIYRYSGTGYPYKVSGNLADEFDFSYDGKPGCCVALRSGKKYMIMPRAWNGGQNIYTYDLYAQTWHRQAVQGAVYGSGRYHYLGEFYTDGAVYKVDASKQTDAFTVESAWINRLDDGYQYIEKLFLQISGTSEIEAAFAYDGGEFTPKRPYRAQNGLVTIPLGQRSNTFAFRLFVPQNGKIHVLGYTMQQGGNHSGRF